MSEAFKVKGLAELQKFLDQLPEKMERNVVRGALRAGMKVILPVAQANVNSVSGLLAAGMKLSGRVRDGRITASIKTAGPHAYIAKWLEFGTRAHTITAKGKGALSFGGIFAKSVWHPGIAPYGDKSVIGPHAFLRPALDGQAQNAVVAAAEYMKKRLAAKHGLDTADIEISTGE